MTPVGYKLNGKPLSIWRPLIGESLLVVTVVLGSVCDGTHLAALKIKHLKLSSILQEGYLLAIGRELRHCTLYIILLKELLLFNEGGIGKVKFLLINLCSLHKSPKTIPLCRVDNCLAVRRDCKACLCARSIGNALCGCILVCCGKDLASCNEGYLLAIVGYCKVAWSREVECLCV